MNLIAIDIGGTTIKIATWINQKLKMIFTIDTPDNLDTFYEELTDAVNEIKADHKIDGVAISSPVLHASMLTAKLKMKTAMLL